MSDRIIRRPDAELTHLMPPTSGQYCPPCNRHHKPGSTPSCTSEAIGAVIGWLLLTVAITIIALAMLGISAGVL